MGGSDEVGVVSVHISGVVSRERSFQVTCRGYFTDLWHCFDNCLTKPVSLCSLFCLAPALGPEKEQMRFWKSPCRRGHLTRPEMRTGSVVELQLHMKFRDTCMGAGM